jgi:DNA repair ATPase RecN
MDDEKLDKTIEFILNNQAQFSANNQQLQEYLREFQKTADKRFNALERATVNLYNLTIEISANIKDLSSDVKQLRESQKETDERLNTVIFMAEKFFGSQNGKSES